MVCMGRWCMYIHMEAMQNVVASLLTNAKMLIMKPARSDSRCAASVRMASDPATSPPITSHIMNTTQQMDTRKSFLVAVLFLSNSASL